MLLQIQDNCDWSFHSISRISTSDRLIQKMKHSDIVDIYGVGKGTKRKLLGKYVCQIMETSVVQTNHVIERLLRRPPCMMQIFCLMRVFTSTLCLFRNHSVTPISLAFFIQNRGYAGRLMDKADWGYTDSRQDEQDRGITVKASSMSLVLQDSKAPFVEIWM